MRDDMTELTRMTREQFLRDQHVVALIEWLRPVLRGAEPFVHRYRDRRNGIEWTCSTLHDAFTTYRWKGENWAANKRQLDDFRDQLRSAVAAGDETRATSISEQVLRWGGVWARNGEYLANRRGAWIAELTHMCRVLGRSCEPCTVDLRLVESDARTACRLNAGFVKVYSVLLDHFVIYDGRVGAALGLLVRNFCRQANHPIVPGALAFAYGAPKEAEQPKERKLRNPSHETLTFPKLRNDPRFHAAQAIRANWLLKAALDAERGAFSPAEDGFHELAAALFMIGYDLSAAVDLSKP
jgi:hypothetical protein